MSPNFKCSSPSVLRRSLKQWNILKSLKIIRAHYYHATEFSKFNLNRHSSKRRLRSAEDPGLTLLRTGALFTGIEGGGPVLHVGNVECFRAESTDWNYTGDHKHIAFELTATLLLTEFGVKVGGGTVKGISGGRNLKGAILGGGTLVSNKTGEWDLKKGSTWGCLARVSNMLVDKNFWSKFNGDFSKPIALEGGGWANHGPRGRVGPAKERVEKGTSNSLEKKSDPFYLVQCLDFFRRRHDWERNVLEQILNYFKMVLEDTKVILQHPNFHMENHLNRYSRETYWPVESS